jgi:hypothetical protein
MNPSEAIESKGSYEMNRLRRRTGDGVQQGVAERVAEETKNDR